MPGYFILFLNIANSNFKNEITASTKSSHERKSDGDKK